VFFFCFFFFDICGVRGKEYAKFSKPNFPFFVFNQGKIKMKIFARQIWKIIAMMLVRNAGV
jgi:hypothetical protein